LSETILQVKDLQITFQVFEGLAKVIDGVSFELKKEEVIALVGETGCGKSLTAKSILGVLPPEAKISGGVINYRNQNLLKLDEKGWRRLRGKEIAMVPQNPMISLDPLLTVGDQLIDLINLQDQPDISLFSYYVRRSEITKERDTWAKATRMLEDVALKPADRVMNSYPFQISGGMAQRVCIAMALSGNPSLLIADEPGTSLDVTSQKVILDLLNEKIRERGLSVIFITHNLGVARQIANRILIMYAGCIAEAWEADKIFREPLHPYSIGLKKAIPTLLLTKMIGIPGRVPSYIDPPVGCRFNTRCPYAMEICRKVKPELVMVGDGHEVACYLYKGQRG